MDMELLNRTKTAEILGVNRRTLEAWEKRGIGPPVIRINGRPYSTPGDLKSFISSHRDEPSEGGDQP